MVHNVYYRDPIAKSPPFVHTDYQTMNKIKMQIKRLMTWKQKTDSGKKNGRTKLDGMIGFFFLFLIDKRSSV